MREIQTSGPIRLSEAPALGLTRRELTGPSFVRIRHGYYLDAELDRDDPDVRIRVAQKLAGDRAVLGGWAAARVLEMLTLDGLPQGTWMQVFDGLVPWPEGRGEPEDLLLCSPARKISPSPGTRVMRTALSPEDRIVVGSTTITSPLRTAFDLARTRSLGAGLVGVDRLAHLGLISVEAFGDYVTEHRGMRGVAQAAKVQRLADAGAESPPETLTRLVWLDAGLPRPEANSEVRDRAGRFIARVDLLDRSHRLVAEYDGAHHASSAQRSRDSARELALESLGFTVVKVTAADLESPAAREGLRRRFRAAYHHARQRRG